MAGGGPAGVCAAVAASRAGVRVLLVERHGYLGGNATGGLVGPFSTNYFAGKKVIAGLLDEVIERLAAKGATLGTQRCPYPPGTTFGTGGWITTFDSEVLKVVFDEMTLEAGVALSLHTCVVGAEVSQKELKGIYLQSKAGRHWIKGGVFVDATGDGDLAAFARARHEIGDETGMGQPATLIFELAGVDLAAIKQYMIDHPEEFAWQTFPELPSNPEQTCVAGSGFIGLIRQAKEKGELDLGRNRITFFSGVRPGWLKVNATRASGVDALNPVSLTKAETDARAQAFSLLKFMRQYVPGCQQAELARMGSYLGIRESRRIMGEYVLTAEDVLSGKRFNDAIGCGAYPLDKHKTGVVPAGEAMDDVWVELEDAYDIPYRCLVPLDVERLLVAGRPISVTHEAMASTRLMAHCMVTGQAAGVAAAISAREGVSPRSIPAKQIQAELTAQGAYIRGGNSYE